MKRNPYHTSAKSVSALVLALVCLSTTIGCQQMTADGYNCTGVRKFQEGKLVQATEDFKKAIYYEPQNADAHYNLAASYHQHGIANKKQDYLVEAEKRYNTCLNLSPDHTDCHRALAVLLAQTNRQDKAFTLMQRWSQRNPGSIDARIELARLYEEKGDIATAKNQLQQAIAINAYDARNSRAWSALARIHEGEGNLAQALNNYRQASELNSFQDGVSQRIASLESRVGGWGHSGDPNGVRLVNEPSNAGTPRR